MAGVNISRVRYDYLISRNNKRHDESSTRVRARAQPHTNAHKADSNGIIIARAMQRGIRESRREPQFAQI